MIEIVNSDAKTDVQLFACTNVDEDDGADDEHGEVGN